MSQETTIEKRLDALEKEVAQLKQRLEQATAQRSWIDQIAGSMKDRPEFGEVLRLGAAIRQADRPADDS